MKPQRKNAVLNAQVFDFVAAQPLETIGGILDAAIAEEAGV